MSKFIAAMDHSGGSTGGVLERYEQEYTEDDKMKKVHAMRMRMVNSPKFTSENIKGAILYKDTLDRGMAPILHAKQIPIYLKVDSGCNPDGTLKYFDVDEMIQFATKHGCTGTKMRSIVHSVDMIAPVLNQQFKLAKEIAEGFLMPIIEPEVPIDSPDKAEIEWKMHVQLRSKLDKFLSNKNTLGLTRLFTMLKLTPPESDNLYYELSKHYNVDSIVALSGGYSTNEACERLSKQRNISASFSRALSEGLFFSQSEEEFNNRINQNIDQICRASGG